MDKLNPFKIRISFGRCLKIQNYKTEYQVFTDEIAISLSESRFLFTKAN